MIQFTVILNREILIHDDLYFQLVLAGSIYNDENGCDELGGSEWIKDTTIAKKPS